MTPPTQPYITTDQYKQGLAQAQLQGIQPDTFLTTLVNNGYVVQGYNDQSYNNTITAQNNSAINPGANQQQQPSQNNQGGFLDSIGGFVKGAVKSLAQPFVSGAGSAVRSLESIPALLSGDVQKAGQIQATPIFGEKTIPGMTPGEALGTGAEALSYLTPTLGLGPVISGAIAGGEFGAGNAAVNDKSSNEVIGSGLVGALGGAALGYVGNKIVGGITGNGGYNGAVNNAEDIISMAKKYNGSIPQDLMQGAKDLAQDNPNAIIQVPVKTLQLLDDAGVPPQYLKAQMNPADVQALRSKLNVLATQSSDKTAGMLNGLKQTFSTEAKDALNQAVPGVGDKGVGDKLEELYTTTAQRYNMYQTLGKTFGLGGEKPDIGAQQANDLISALKKQSSTPEGKIVLQRALKDFADSTGIDFTDKVKAAQYAATLRPAAKKIFVSILKYAGLPALGLGVEQHLTH